MDLRLRYRAATTHRFDEPIALMTQRRRLDHFLAETAAGAGRGLPRRRRASATSRSTAPAAAPSSRSTGASGSARSVLIGADGANGVTAKALGLGGDRTFGVALEGNAPMTPEREAVHRGRATLEIDTVPGGYGWIFPKADHINVGVGGWASEGPRMRRFLDALCAMHDVRPEELTDVRGHRLPLRRVVAGRRARPRGGGGGRRGPDRPALRRRDVRGVPVVRDRHRHRARPAGRARQRDGALPAGACSAPSPGTPPPPGSRGRRWSACPP